VCARPDPLVAPVGVAIVALTVDQHRQHVRVHYPQRRRHDRLVVDHLAREHELTEPGHRPVGDRDDRPLTHDGNSIGGRRQNVHVRVACRHSLYVAAALTSGW